MRITATVLGTAIAFAALSGVATAETEAPHIPAPEARLAGCSIPSKADPAVLRTLKSVGDQQAISAKVRLAMFETAWVESHANNLPCGDRDSVGVFQQRPSQGWGSQAQCMNVPHATNSFLARAIPTAAKHPSWSAGQVAQSVQGSAYPSRYDQSRAIAEQLIRQSGGDPGSESYAWPIVSSGQSSPRVRAVQGLLVSRGYNIAVDGVFGQGTASAVKQFQSRAGLSADGIVGAATWPRLVLTLSSGSKGAAVSALQQELRAHGYNIGVSGTFNDATANAVKTFQKGHHLTVDGVVGPATWNVIVHFH